MSPVDDEKKGKRRELHQKRVNRQAIAHQRPGGDVDAGVDQGKEVNQGKRRSQPRQPAGRFCANAIDTTITHRMATMEKLSVIRAAA
jgi:hypothetical protein